MTEAGEGSLGNLLRISRAISPWSFSKGHKEEQGPFPPEMPSSGCYPINGCPSSCTQIRMSTNRTWESTSALRQYCHKVLFKNPVPKNKNAHRQPITLGKYSQPGQLISNLKASTQRVPNSRYESSRDKNGIPVSPAMSVRNGKWRDRSSERSLQYSSVFEA